MGTGLWQASKERRLGYAQRLPTQTPLSRLIYYYRDELAYRWDELYGEKYGVLRDVVLEAFDAYLNCGILFHGAARVYCDTCKHSQLLAFSCKRRGLCPSCDTKRAHIFAEHLHQNVLLPYEHRHVIFSIPKRLRIYFRYDRGLTKHLYQAAWRAWKEYVASALLDGLPGAILSLHSAGDLLPWHPHIHGIFLGGVIDAQGVFHQLSQIDTEKLTALFSKHVFESLLAQGLITDEVVMAMSTWEHSGFHVYAGEPITSDDADLRRFIARYLKKSPLALERMSIMETSGEPKVRLVRKLDDCEQFRDFSPLEFLAQLSTHIPDVWEQTVRFYGMYSARTRGKLRKDEQLLAQTNNQIISGSTNNSTGYAIGILPNEPKRPVSKQWSIWIKRVYEVDPLCCRKCGSPMRIVAFIHDSREILRITKHLGITAWKAPPKFTAQANEQILSFHQ